MADGADLQKVLQQKKEERHRLEQERQWLMQRDSKERKLTSAMALATKRAKRVKTIDLCFVVDLTASMQWWLKTVHEKMDEIIEDNRQYLGELARVRVAFVGYRDYDDKDHPVVHPFTNNIDEIKTFLKRLEANGGGDVSEDVLTGLEEALKLDWSATAKVLYLLSQTPHHGWRFHQLCELNTDAQSLKEVVAASGVQDKAQVERSLPNEFYDLHCEDPRQWTPMDDVLKEFQQRGVQMVILRLGTVTDKMIQVFKQQYSVPGTASLELKVYDARRDAKHFRCIVSSSSANSFSGSASRMGQARAVPQKLLTYVVDDTPVNWEVRDGWCTVEAQLYTYIMNEVDEPPQKTSCPFMAALHPRPFGKGAMRFAFYLVDQGHPDRKYVGKVYQFDDPAFQQKSTYEGDMASQAVAGYLAKEFSVQYVEDPIEFVQAQLLDLGADSDFPFRFMAIEPWIPGRYEKFTSNAGYISKDSDLAQAFTHFTWEFTAGDIMVADIQGGGNTLTDPQIHSQDTDRFGRGNLATKGMDAFFLNHTCNDICHTLKLREHPLQPGPAPEDVVAWPGLNAIPEMATSGQDLKVDWMPLPGSKLSLFLDAVRTDAMVEWLEGSATCTLGGAVVEWQGRWPKIAQVLPDSPAFDAECRADTYLDLVGAQKVEGWSREEVLKLLASDNNMMVFRASNDKIKSMLSEASRESSPARGDLRDMLHFMSDLEDHLEHVLEGLSRRDEAKGFLHDLFAKKHMFLDRLRLDATERLQQPDSSEGWNDELQVPYDSLAGATFAWTQPPRVLSVAAGSPAEGQLSIGDALIAIDEENTERMSRLQILKQLENCRGIEVRVGDATRSEQFERLSGLEVGSMAGRRMTWTDPPSFHDGNLLLEIGGVEVFGKSKQEVLALLKTSDGWARLDLEHVKLGRRLSKLGCQDRLQELKVPVHMDFTCQGCAREPLIGACHTCKDCSVHLCSACYRGRAHAHTPGHSFSVLEYAGADAFDAKPPPKLEDGSAVVVIGTGKKWDGQPGLAMNMAPASSEGHSLWTVLIEGEDEALELEAKHLFLRSEEAQKCQETDLAAPQNQKPEAKPEVLRSQPESTPLPSSKSHIPEPAEPKPRFTLVQPEEMGRGLTRQKSARELRQEMRQEKGQEALDRFQAAPPTARKVPLLCKGKCGTMVETEKADYIKKGQAGVFCELCSQKCIASKKQASCQKCTAGFEYSQFVLDLEGSRSAPNLCNNCRESQEDGWAIVSGPISST
ncbi:Alpha-protein kinase 1 (AK1) [Durusdinium trenchii]|uniref:Alpha-protein kinase 1 (AK1) n=1 Tax=Durusdinium trenchii TaxID=1381693 RepID=A0ABP0NFT2_9DINO